MKKLLFFIVILYLSICSINAQTRVSDPYARRFVTYDILPLTCRVGDKATLSSTGKDYSCQVTNTWSEMTVGISTNPFTDTTAIIKGSGDATKLLRFEVDGFATGITRVITPPNNDTSLPIYGQTITYSGPTAARTVTYPDSNFIVARTDATNTFTGVQTFVNNIIFNSDNSSDIGTSAANRPRNIYVATQVLIDKTYVTGGTTGAQTINKARFSVNFAATSTSLVVTNSLVTATSGIICQVNTNDTTFTYIKAAVPASGSITLFANAAATAETRVTCEVLN